MKRNAIARIIIYAIMAIVLSAILCGFLIMDDFIINIGSSDGEVMDGELSVPTDQVKNIEIDWAAGSIEIRTADTDHITVSEQASEEIKYKMTYKISGNTLKLSYASGNISIGLNKPRIPEKALIITVPENWVCGKLQIDGASLDINIDNLTVAEIDLDGASCNLEFLGSVDQVEIDGASMDIQLNCTNRVSSIDVDGASCNLELALPYGCGFVVDVDGLSYGFHTELPITTEGDQKIYGDGHCKISVDGLSCDVTIAEDSLSSSEKPECAHTWDTGTLISNTDICYTCTLCGESYTVTDDNLVMQEKYNNAAALAAEGKKAEAAIVFARLGDYSNSRERSLNLWNEVRLNTTVVAYNGSLIGIRSDGSLILHNPTENPLPEVENWTNVCSLATGQDHIVGLKSDGTVVATGDNAFGQCRVEDWTQIISIDCGANFTIGLRSDGTILYTGADHYGTSESVNWTDIVMVEAAGKNIVALKANGTALTLGDKNNQMCETPEWDDIIDIYLDTARAIYLRADGTFQIMGNSLYIEDQTIQGLVTVESDGNYLSGKKLDGTMYFFGYGQNSILQEHIVAIIDYANRKLALLIDGKLVHLFFYSGSIIQVPEWNDIMQP